MPTNDRVGIATGGACRIGAVGGAAATGDGVAADAAVAASGVAPVCAADAALAAEDDATSLDANGDAAEDDGVADAPALVGVTTSAPRDPLGAEGAADAALALPAAVSVALVPLANG